MYRMTDLCSLCGAVGEQRDPLIADEFYLDIQMHLHCLNSAAGVEWRRVRAEADPGYARYLSLTTVGLPISCPTCATTALVSPKAYGMGAGLWEANCTGCHRSRQLLSAYRAFDRPSLERLALLAQRFNFGENSADVVRDTVSLASEYDAIVLPSRCECGSSFSIAAPPRLQHMPECRNRVAFPCGAKRQPCCTRLINPPERWPSAREPRSPYHLFQGTSPRSSLQ
jgi:hypothetical protein